MKPDFRSAIRRTRLFFDGGTGTMLQSLGLKPGEGPETRNLTHPEQITALHRAYLDAGCRILKTNTFGVNRDKYENYRELIAAAVSCAKQAAEDREDVYLAFDIGPTGRLLEPLGDLPFEEAVSLFADNVRAAASAGVDLILIETMNDSYETKAAVLGAKEASDLPIVVTNVYDERGRLMTGASPEAMVALLEGLGVDALGINCSLGPDRMRDIVDKMVSASSLPIVVNPNAGLPEIVDGVTTYTLGPEAFASSMKTLAEHGAGLLGGCCGTTPAHLKALIAAVSDLPYPVPEPKAATVVSSYADAVVIGDDPILIGERINPTGKPRLKEALRSGDMNYLVNEGIRQEEAGAHILDVNVGLPDVNEPETMVRTVTALQAATALPLQIDSASPEALAAALRIYNGKPLINSVSGEAAKMKAIFPLVKRYGGVLVVLTMDENGIPETADGRVKIAQRVAAEAARSGISERDLIFDPLTLAVSADPKAAAVTLEAVRRLKALGFRTVLGVSNVSFGLPERTKINAAFFTAALEGGLSAAILNPFSTPMTDARAAYRVLHGLDPACASYIGYAEAHPAAPAGTAGPAAPASPNSAAVTGSNPIDGLTAAIRKGLKAEAVSFAAALLKEKPPLAAVEQALIPALNQVGSDFEAKKIYLPQLLMSAEAASAAFDRLKRELTPAEKQNGREIILATVKGDIHDIGKNIVKVLMESYGFTVRDLGRDVPPEAVLDCALRSGCRLVGLSALMTTTVPAMEETIRLLHAAGAGIRVIVGGAVLTQEYADMIGADGYSADATGAVALAKAFYGEA